MSTRHGSSLSPVFFNSPVTAVAGDPTITIDLSDVEDFWSRAKKVAHWRAAVEFYTDAAGGEANLASPTSGTATFTVEVDVLRGIFQSITWDEQSAGGGVIDLSNPNEQVDWDSGATRKVRVALSSIAGGSVTHAQLRVYGHGI